MSSNKKSFEKIFHDVNLKSIYYKKHNKIIDKFNIKVKVFFIIVSKNKFNCRRCNEKFSFNNKLYYYVKQYKIILKSKIFYNRFETKIIHSTTFNNFNFKFNFKFWRYAKIKVNIDSFYSNVLISICLNFNCKTLIINRFCLIFQRSNYKNYVLKMLKLLKIKNIKSSILIVNKYILTNFVIFNEVNNKLITIYFIRNFYIINNFKINMLFNNNILKSKKIFIYVD